MLLRAKHIEFAFHISALLYMFSFTVPNAPVLEVE